MCDVNFWDWEAQRVKFFSFNFLSRVFVLLLKQCSLFQDRVQCSETFHCSSQHSCIFPLKICVFQEADSNDNAPAFFCRWCSWTAFIGLWRFSRASIATPRLFLCWPCSAMLPIMSWQTKMQPMLPSSSEKIVLNFFLSDWERTLL